MRPAQPTNTPPKKRRSNAIKSSITVRVAPSNADLGVADAGASDDVRLAVAVPVRGGHVHAAANVAGVGEKAAERGQVGSPETLTSGGLPGPYR